MKQNQLGFGAIELLLTIIALTLIGFVGYYVWHSQQNVDKTLSASKSSSSTTIAKATTPSNETKYFVIKEWGARAPYNDADMYTYKIDGPIAKVISTKLAKLDKGCEAFGAGSILRFAPTDIAYPSESTAEEAFKAAPETYVKVGDYYFRFSHDQAACANDTKAVTIDMHNAENDVTKMLVSKLEAIQ